MENLDFADRSRIRNREIGFIFQSFNLIGDLTVYENVELPLTYRRGCRRRSASAGAGIAGARRHGPSVAALSSQLSGGQQQRVAVARALAGSPSILLADEPTGNLDSRNGEAVMELLQELHREGATICMVTHDPRFAAHAQREVHLFDGKVVAEEELQKLMAETRHERGVARRALRVAAVTQEPWVHCGCADPLLPWVWSQYSRLQRDRGLRFCIRCHLCA